MEIIDWVMSSAIFFIVLIAIITVIPNFLPDLNFQSNVYSANLVYDDLIESVESYSITTQNSSNIHPYSINLKNKKANGKGIIKKDNNYLYGVFNNNTKIFSYNTAEDKNIEKIYNFYITQDGLDYNIWTKVNLLPNEEKTIYINKNYGFLSNGEDVFETFTDPGFTVKTTTNQPTISVKNLDSNIYIVKITNNESESLYDFQINIPNDIIGVTSQNDPLLIYSKGTKAKTLLKKEAFKDYNYSDTFQLISGTANFEKDKLQLSDSAVLQTINSYSLVDGSIDYNGIQLDVYFNQKDNNNSLLCKITDKNIGLYKIEKENQTLLNITNYTKENTWQKIGFGIDKFSRAYCRVNDIIIGDKYTGPLTSGKIQIKPYDTNSSFDNFKIYKNTDLTVSDTITYTDNAYVKQNTNSINVNLFKTQDLNYYIEDYNSSIKYVWTKLNIPANSTKILYLRKKPGYTPNGEEIFEFFDDFDDSSLDTNKWSVFGESYGSISQNNSEITISNTSGTSSDFTGIYSGDYLTTNKAIRTKSKVTTGSDATLIGYASSPYNPVPSLDSTNGASWYGNASTASSTIDLANDINTSTYSLATHDPTNYEVFDIELDSGSINFYKDQSLAYQETNEDNIYNGILPAYLSTKGTSTLVSDYVFVRQKASIEPTVTISDQNNTWYKIDVTNNLGTDLEGYQIKLSGDSLNVNDKNQSIQIKESFDFNINYSNNLDLNNSEKIAFIKDNSLNTKAIVFPNTKEFWFKKNTDESLNFTINDNTSILSTLTDVNILKLKTDSNIYVNIYSFDNYNNLIDCNYININKNISIDSCEKDSVFRVIVDDESISNDYPQINILKSKERILTEDKLNNTTLFSDNLPYYIEDTGIGYSIWTKTNLSSGETKKIYIKKESGFLPNGSKVFETYTNQEFTTQSINPSPEIIVRDIENKIYEITINNKSNTNVVGYQIEIPNNLIQVSSTLDSLKIYEISDYFIKIETNSKTYQRGENRFAIGTVLERYTNYLNNNGELEIAKVVIKPN